LYFYSSHFCIMLILLSHGAVLATPLLGPVGRLGICGGWLLGCIPNSKLLTHGVFIFAVISLYLSLIVYLYVSDTLPSVSLAGDLLCADADVLCLWCLLGHFAGPARTKERPTLTAAYWFFTWLCHPGTLTRQPCTDYIIMDYMWISSFSRLYAQDLPTPVGIISHWTLVPFILLL
jgi:hypothetical protein